MKPSLLIIENNPALRKLLRLALETVHYKLTECTSIKEGLRLTQASRPSLILFDLGISLKDGEATVRNLRRLTAAPLIVCSARGDDSELITALENGADDYLSTPINPVTMLARITAHLRRAPASNPVTSLANGALRIDMTCHEVWVDGRPVEFTPYQYALLRYMFDNRGQTLPYSRILTEVWGKDYAGKTQYLRVYMQQLREKIEADPRKPRYLRTLSGIGYRMEMINN